MSASTGTRQQQKEATRRALMDAALRLLAADRSFEGLSLRAVTREAGIVPTAFYRHFADMEELGLALVDASFDTLRRMMREARDATLPEEQVIRRSVHTYVRYVQANRLHFHFISRERYGGVAALRQAIRDHIDLFVSELATDLGRFPVLDRWTTADLRMIASLTVSAMVAATERILDLADDHGPAEEEEIMRNAEKQLRLIMLAVPAWRSGGAEASGVAQGRPEAAG